MIMRDAKSTGSGMTHCGVTRREMLAATGLMAAAGSVPASAFASDRLPEHWNLGDLFADEAAWARERAEIEAAIPELAARPIDDALALKSALEQRSAFELRTWRLVLYAALRSDEDIRIAENAERRASGLALQARIDTALSWLPGAIIALGAARVAEMVAGDAGLAVYRYPLSSILRRSAHTLDAKGEALLASAAPLLGSAQNIRQTLFSSDIAFPEIIIAGAPVRIDLDGYGRVMTSAERPVRERAYDLYARTIRKHEQTFGAVLGAKISGNVFAARAREYPTALDASLDAAAIPRTVYDILLAEVDKQLALHHRYLAVKHRLLGVDKLAVWDVSAPAVSLDRRWNVDVSRKTTLRALAPLGAGYVAQFADATKQRWADTRPRAGKREGGYVAGQGYSHPFVLLNHNDDFASLSTYAHEWGHALHSCYARAQPYPLYDFPTFVAEIPSKANELLLLDNLISEARTPQERVFFLDRLCEQYRGTLFTQSMFADFELAIHTAAERGQPMAGSVMSDRYGELMAHYFGPEVQLHPDSGTLWATVLHFYLNFYVFQYATCLVAATALVEAIKREGLPARERYLKLLAAGGSNDAYLLIRDAGVDLADPQPYRWALKRFERAIDDLEIAAAASG
jgi:oligoendopeptidase F